MFTYEAGGPASLVTRTEEADISGRVKGSYTITTADGKTRSVNYKADKSGFQANVHTNEPGTETHDPANVSFVSSARSHTDFGGVQKPYKPRPLEVCVHFGSLGLFVVLEGFWDGLSATRDEKMEAPPSF